MKKATDFRSLFFLIFCQAFNGAAAPIVITLGGVVGYRLAPSTDLATLPISLFAIGTALASLPASAVMGRFGRRPGFIVGAFLSFFGGICAASGIYFSDFFIFCLGTLAIGMSVGTGQFYRFAAGELASEADRPKVISWVLTGGIIAAVIGPQTVFWMRDSMDEIPDGTPFLAVSVFAFLVAIILFRVAFPPVAPVSQVGKGRSLGQLLRDPAIFTPIACGAVSYCLMLLVMTAAPVAMEHINHHSKGDAALGIQWHVLAMYVPSFFTGSLIVRFGQRAIISAGMVILVGAGLVALSGVEVLHYWGALILLGIGWNFGYIGSTSLLTLGYRPEEKNRVEGINDFVVFSSTAVASVSAGLLLSTFGWAVINYLIFPATLFALVLLPLALRQRSA